MKRAGLLIALFAVAACERVVYVTVHEPTEPKDHSGCAVMVEDGEAVVRGLDPSTRLTMVMLAEQTALGTSYSPSNTCYCLGDLYPAGYVDIDAPLDLERVR